jgi:N-acyl-D-amino-acid deacylase
MFAGTEELIDLCSVVAEFGGYYCPHTRSYGKGALESYAEMVDIARRSGCPLHLTHATMNFAPNRGRAQEFLALVDDAREEGLDISLDTYPYLPASTTLSALLPSWTATSGPEAFLASLDDAAVRERLRHELEEVGTDGHHGCVTEWDTIQISGVHNAALEGYVGRSVDEIATAEGVRPSEVFFRILRDDNMATSVLQHVGDEENVRTIMRHPAHCGGSDGILVGGRPHPRAWGTFPRYLARYVRELGVLSLPDCIHHLTGRPARRLHLRERGLVRPGYHADLVLFDPARVRDAATFEQPRTQAEGIPWVLVDGTPVIEEGHRTEALPGRALRRTNDGATHR